MSLKSISIPSNCGFATCGRDYTIPNPPPLEGIEAITKAPSDYFLPLKEQDGTLQSNEANTGVFVKTRSLQKLQRKMTVLYEKQKEKGALVQNNFSS